MAPETSTAKTAVQVKVMDEPTALVWLTGVRTTDVINGSGTGQHKWDKRHVKLHGKTNDIHYYMYYIGRDK